MEKLIQEYLEYRKTLNLSRDTLKGDRVCLNKFKLFLDNQGLTFNRITTEQIRNYQESLKVLSPFSLHKYLNTLRQFCDYCHRKNRILLNPFRNLELPVYPCRLPHSIPSPGQLRQLFQSIDLTTWRGFRDRAMLELTYSAGLRLGEIINLRLDDLDLANRLVRICGKGTKERIVPFGKAAAHYLKLYLKIRPKTTSPTLFLNPSGKKLSRNIQRFQRYAQRMGLKFKFHNLRHACALHMLQNRANIRHIQELLGHSDPETTQIYTGLVPLDLKKAHHRYHPREKEAMKHKTALFPTNDGRRTTNDEKEAYHG